MPKSNNRRSVAGGKRHIKELDPSVIDPTSLIMLIGKRNTGKTYLMKDLAWNWHNHGMKDGAKIDMVICMSPTELLKGDFRSFIPYAHLYPCFNESVVYAIREKQKKVIKEHGLEKAQRILLLIDDSVLKRDFLKASACASSPWSFVISTCAW